jgi:hypothetical protein
LCSEETRRTSDGIAWIIEIVLSVNPINIPPPINAFIEVALAETTAPAKAMMGGIEAKYFLSTTSERRPMMGEIVDCIRRGAYECKRMDFSYLNVGTYLDDPPSESGISNISNDECNYGSRSDSVNLCHNT